MRLITVGVVSDTHVPVRARFLPGEVFRGLDGVDLILHAGDILDESVIRELATVAPVRAVAGNCDPWSLRDRLGPQKIVEVGGVKIGLTHGHLGTGRTAAERAASLFVGQEVACVVFGHSHSPYNEVVDGVLLFNPGSPTDRRHEPLPSYGILTIDSDAGSVEGRVVFFDPGQSRG